MQGQDGAEAVAVGHPCVGRRGERAVGAGRQCQSRPRYVFIDLSLLLVSGADAALGLEKLAALQMLDVHLPTTNGREVILTRYTQPEPDQRLILEKLKLRLPVQLPPKITAAQARAM